MLTIKFSVLLYIHKVIIIITVFMVFPDTKMILNHSPRAEPWPSTSTRLLHVYVDWPILHVAYACVVFSIFLFSRYGIFKIHSSYSLCQDFSHFHWQITFYFIARSICVCPSITSSTFELFWAVPHNICMNICVRAFVWFYVNSLVYSLDYIVWWLIFNSHLDVIENHLEDTPLGAFVKMLAVTANWERNERGRLTWNIAPSHRLGSQTEEERKSEWDTSSHFCFLTLDAVWPGDPHPCPMPSPSQWDTLTAHEPEQTFLP